MFADIIWIFLVLETFVLGALCKDTCPFVHPQKWFCSSKFVIRGKILEQINLPAGQGFRMEIKKVLKGDLEELNITANRYVTLEIARRPHSLTGMDLLIFGRNKNGRIYSNMCTDDMQWLSRDEDYGHYFRKSYRTGCECIDNIGNYSSDKKCHWYTSFMKKFGKHCKWVETDEFQRCRAKNGRTW